LRDIEGIKKKVNELICVLKCVCGKRTFRDMGGIFKKVNYIYMSANECVREGEKKVLTFQRERAIWPGEEKPIQARQNFQFKSVKALGIAWRG